LEQVDHVAQSAIVASISDGAFEGRIDALTEQAPRFAEIRLAAILIWFLLKVGGKMQVFSANGAVRPLERTQRGEARFANGEPGNSYKWGTTDTAVGGKKGEE
ncbi:MAG: hypothetical protein WAJ97_08730, partial [Terriglobales bacterium]